MTTTLPIAEIVTGKRSRTEFRGIESLAESIRRHSLLQPPVVRKDGDRWILVCGERRLTALKSLGWTETPVTVAESITDELEALYAEGDENTEREPFTITEAIEHRRRIRDAESRAARDRMAEAGRKSAPGRPAERSGKFPDLFGGEVQPPAPPHPAAPQPTADKRTTRERTAKATGYSGKTLDKAERVLDVAEDETQPEPVRELARESVEKLSQPGASVDREYKKVQQAVIDNSDHAQAFHDAQWRKELAKAIDAVNSVTTFSPERTVAISDDDLLFLIDSNCKAIAEWHAEITRLRKPGLRVVSGGSS